MFSSAVQEYETIKPRPDQLPDKSDGLSHSIVMQT